MFRTAATLAIATLTAACLGGPPLDTDGRDDGAEDAVEVSADSLSLQANPAIQLLLARPADDKAMGTPVSSHVYSGASIAFIDGKLNVNGMRLTNLERDPNDPALFTATMVKNTGPYYIKDWWYAQDATENTLVAQLSNNDARLIDLQKYATAGGDRFAAVMVKNTGVHKKLWWWYDDVSADTLAWTVNFLGARITSLKSRIVNGQTLYTAILIKNTGIDQKQSWWYPNVTPQWAEQALTDHGARPIDIERRPNGNLDIVMVKNDGVGWWWWSSLASIHDVTDIMAQKAVRPIELERFYVNGERRYAVLFVDNANPDTRRVDTAFSDFLTDGVYGARVKRVGGGVSVSLNDQYVFDPASALKVAHHTYALGTEFAQLNALNAFSYPVDPQNPNNTSPCPDNTWMNVTNQTQTTIANGLALMMQNSDNRVTRGFEDRYTRANLNDMMADLGMSKSSFHQFIGCGYDNGNRNRTTARDLAHIYDRVTSGTVLPLPARQVFFSTLLQGVPNNIQQMITEEGGKLGKSAGFITTFIAGTQLHSKGGSYDVCLDNNCNVYEYVRSQAGVLTVPVKPQCGGLNSFVNGPSERKIAYSRYITEVVVPCAPQGATESLAQAEGRCAEFKAANDAMTAAQVELFRGEVRSAIQTWNEVCNPAPAGNALNELVVSVLGGAGVPKPGVEPDEIDYDGAEEDPPRAPSRGVEPDEID